MAKDPALSADLSAFAQRLGHVFDRPALLIRAGLTGVRTIADLDGRDRVICARNG